MAKKPETVLKERFLERVKKLPFTYVDKIQQVGRRGSSDVYLCIGGVFCAVEFKSKKELKPDKLQEYKLARIAACGGIALVVYPENEEASYQLLENIAKESARYMNGRKCSVYQ